MGVWNNQVDPADPSPHGRSHLGGQLLVGVVHLVGHIDGISTSGDIGISPQMSPDTVGQDGLRCKALLVQHEAFDVA